jgi:protein-cysteine N-palmitoyltransferase HHAT
MTSYEKIETLDKQPNKPRWLTTEFIIYYFVIGIGVFFFIKSAFLFSRPTHPSFVHHKHLLGKSFFGLHVDDSDSQYNGFRSYVIQLSLSLFFFTILNKLISRFASERRKNVMQFIVSLAVLVILHGSNVLKIFLIIVPGYLIGTITSKKTKFLWLSPLLTWIHIIASLFIIEWYQWKFASLSPFLSFLDEFTGTYRRWNIIFKISCLRMISFNLDQYWFHKNDQQLEKSKEEFESIEEKDFAFSEYFRYVFYFPLYFAGPIISFTKFKKQEKQGITSTSNAIIAYGLRFAGSFLLLETILHIFHPVAIKEAKAYQGFSPLDFGVLAFLNLKIIWLKLLVIWRFFRLWSLINGIDPPENMVNLKITFS